MDSARRVSAYYCATIKDFLSEDPNQIIGALVGAHSHTLDIEQTRAWQDEIQILKVALREIDGSIYLEFDVPRLGSRIDVVVLSGPAIFPIEFKCGESQFHRADYNQAWDYALDLKNFHLGSHSAPIFPILLATKAASSDEQWQVGHRDEVRPPRRCAAADLPRMITEGLMLVGGAPMDATAWGTAPYQPTPTIIEAARSLYAKHSVEAISRNDAGPRIYVLHRRL